MTEIRIFNLIHLSVLFLLINTTSFANDFNTNKNLVLEGKTLYINKDDKYMTDTLLNAFKEHWTITKIKYEDEDEILENLKDKDALTLTLFKKVSDNGIDVREYYFYAIVVGHAKVISPDNLKRYQMGDMLGFMKLSENQNKVKKEIIYNINGKAPLFVKNVQSEILIDNELIKYENEETIKGNSYYIGLAEVQKKTIYIAKSAVSSTFNFKKFCKFNLLDSSKVKVISDDELSAIIHSNEDALILFNMSENFDNFFYSTGDTNDFCYSNTTGENVCLLTTGSYMYIPRNTAYTLYMLLVIGIIVGAIVANT